MSPWSLSPPPHLLAQLSPEERGHVEAYLKHTRIPAGGTAVREGDPGPSMFFVLEGKGHLARGGLRLQSIGAGESFGELGLLGGRPRAASVLADEEMLLAELTLEGWRRLSQQHPAAALRLLTLLVERLGAQLVRATDDVGLLLRERSLPRRTRVQVQVNGQPREIPTGATAGAVLPGEHEGALVVAALLDRKPVSLSTPITADAEVEPLTVRSWEGREVYRRSAGLLLLEAARRAAPGVDLQLGPSFSWAQSVEVRGADPGELAPRLLGEMRRLAEGAVPFIEEQWAVEEAASHLQAQGWSDAELLLRSQRDPTVPMVTCGEVYALSMAPLLRDTGPLRGVGLRVHGGGLLLEFGEVLSGQIPAGVLEAGDPTLAVSEHRRAQVVELDQRAWLDALGVTSVGAFNERCISGQVSELIRVAEGLHEKRIGRIADLVKERGPSLRVISIAGPSSSGKTTFIKRLTVQLQINGITPRAISLDDYYVDREKTVRDAKGDYDFEALEALRLELLRRHIQGIAAGERVATARYDFLTGQSLPDRGPVIQLGPRDVLLIEGIHGLNPALLGDILPREQLFKVFIHPVIGLPFDRLSSVSPADIRLLRRIVRDRHGRGYKAADNILRWPSVRDGERRHIFPFLPEADAIFDTSLVYEPSVLKVYAERYLLEIPRDHPGYTTAFRLRRLLDRFVTIYPDHVPPTSLLREFIGGSGFEY
jgi:uridine kinase